MVPSPAPGIRYCEETTLHGFRYLTKPGVYSKLVWLVTVLTSVLVALYYGIYYNTTEFLEDSKQ